jgi:hypothetical protein
MNLALTDIPKKQLDEFIRLMHGHHGIFSEDRSCGIWDENSHPYKITLYCYLISTGCLYVKYQQLKSVNDGYETLIDFIEDFFKGKCIVNFTDLLFLNEINTAFCGGKWHNVHESWLVDRPEFLDILAHRNTRPFKELQAYEIEVHSQSEFRNLFYLQIADNRTTVIDFFQDRILWRREPINITDLKKEFGIGDKKYTIRPISLEYFTSRIFDMVEPEVGSLLN